MNEKITNEITENKSNNFHVSNVIENALLTKEINFSVLNAVEFCSNILSRNCLGKSLHIDIFKPYRDIAMIDLKYLFDSDQKILKFFRSFPLVFFVEGYQVGLRTWIIFHLNQQDWLRELLPDRFHHVPILISTIQFYCNELFKIAPMFELPISQLFRQKSNAPEAIQAVTKNIKEFVLFLKMYPQIFSIVDDKVLLSEPALAYKSLQVWVKRLMVGDLTVIKNINENKIVADSKLKGIEYYELLKNEVAVYEAVGIYMKMILTNGSVKGVSLKELFIKNERMVPMSKLIKNMKDLEVFIASFPEVFTIIDKTVFLAQLYSDISDSGLNSEINFKFICSESNVDIIDLKCYDKPLVTFYLDILKKNSSNITEFPIKYLVYFSAIASPQILKTVKNEKELKNFLSKYPKLFNIDSSDNVILRGKDASLTSDTKMSPTVNSNITDQGIVKEKSKEILNFYTNIINKLGGSAKIEQLLEYGWKTCKEVQKITTNCEYLKNFFYSQPNDFTVVEDCIILRNKLKNSDFEINSSLKFSKKSATKNAVDFYSNVLKKYRTQVVSLIQMSGHRGSAPADVQSVAKNPKELKIFLSQFPEIFSLDENKVMFSASCEKIITRQYQENIVSSNENNEQQAVQFFIKMLNHYGICRVLNINKLFELKLKSSPTIQKITGSNINQFLAFLLRYPEEFLVTNENVIGRKKIPHWSYSGKYEGKKFTDPLLLIIFNFFKRYTSNKSLFHIDYLYNHVGRFFLRNDETQVFVTRSDLLLFLGLYPHIFFVDYYRVVNLIASSRKAFISADGRQSKLNNQNKQSVSSNPKTEKLKPIVPDIKLPEDLISSSLNIDTKQSLNRIEEDISNKIEKKERNKNKCPKPLRNRINERKKKKTNQNIECSISEESLVSQHSINLNGERVDINSSMGLELKDCFGDNKSSPCWRNDFEGEFNPSKIEEIENNLCSNLIGILSKEKYLTQTNEQLFSFDSQIKSDGTRHILPDNFHKYFCGTENFNEIIIEALLFLNDKLWEEGNMIIIKIEELFQLFSYSFLKMKNFCKNISEFEIFLCQFPDHFIISHNRVMARKNKIQNVNFLFNNYEESLPVALFHFFNLYTKQFNYTFLKLLYSQVGKYFCNINQSPLFKSSRDLGLFLEMFPNVFRIENNQILNLSAPKEKINHGLHKVKFNSGVIKINSFLDKKLFSTIMSEKVPSIPESSDGWKDHVLDRTQIIDDLKHCRAVTSEILHSEKVIALDCEGVNLGAAGILTLVQIGLISGQVYIFDVIKEPSMVNDGGLKDVFESPLILKVIHDSRNDVANLYTEYGVKITPIFDTRVVHHLIENQGIGMKHKSNKLTAIGFNELCSKYGANSNIQKDVMKNVYKLNPSYWRKRPLTKDMVAYAALDVASLPPIFFAMLKKLKGIPERSLWELSGKHSLSVLINKDLLFD